MDNDGRSGIGGRLFIGLMIALIGFFLYMNQTQENPVTKEKQHVTLSPEQEVQLGLNAVDQMAEASGGEVSAGDPRSQKVESMGEYLVSHSEAKNSPWKFRFHLLADEETVNAFALPGGQIFITLGLYNKLQNEAQLAGVLGHEMGHVIERHTAEQMAKNQLGQFLVAAVYAGTSGGDNQSNNSVMIASLVNQMMQLRFSRKDESEADIWGLKLMAKAGYNPYAMIEVMEILKQASKSSGRTLEIFQTHPNPDLRISQISAYLKEHPPAASLTEGKSLSRWQ